MVDALLKNLNSLTNSAEAILNQNGSKNDALEFIKNYQNQSLDQVLTMIQSKINTPGISLMPGFDDMQKAIKQMENLQQLVGQIKTKFSI